MDTTFIKNIVNYQVTYCQFNVYSDNRRRGFVSYEVKVDKAANITEHDKMVRYIDSTAYYRGTQYLHSRIINQTVEVRYEY